MLILNQRLSKCTFFPPKWHQRDFAPSTHPQNNNPVPHVIVTGCKPILLAMEWGWGALFEITSLPPSFKMQIFVYRKSHLNKTLLLLALF